MTAITVVECQSAKCCLHEFFGGRSEDEFPHLKDFVKKIMVLFGITYISEQTFSTVNITKSKWRLPLTDDNLQSVRKISRVAWNLVSKLF